jgi:hypothetical protein
MTYKVRSYRTNHVFLREFDDVESAIKFINET